jgi:peptide/nickel transport system substrate-binding protein
MTFPSTKIPVLGAYGRYIRSLSSGDRLIANILGGLVLLACLVTLIAFTRTFMVAEPAYGGTLTEGVVGTPRFINPLLAISDTDRDLTALTYAGLMGHDANGGLIPVLASGYEESTDGKVYTFTLRANAKFSDNTPVTADDVVYTIMKAQDTSLKSPALANWANVRAEAVDAHTVRFTLPKAYAPFLEDATLGILPAHIWKDVSDARFPFVAQQEDPIAAGPFKVTKIVRASDQNITSYELSSFSGYVLGRPFLSGIRMVFYSDQASLATALKDGAVQSGYGVATKNALRVPYNRVFGVFFNPAQQPLFAKPEVRKALSLAIDRHTLVNDVLGGYATPIAGPVPLGPGVQPVSLPDATTRLADARAVLTAAKWKFNDTSKTWTNGKDTLSVKLTTSNVPELKAVAAQIQSDWQALGVPTTITLEDPSTLTQNVIRPRTYGALLFGEVIGRTPDLFAFWSSTERTDPGLNIADYSNKTADALLNKIRGEHDPATLAQDLSTLNATIAADYPAAFTHTPDFLYTIPSNLHGVHLSQIAAPHDRFDGVSHWYMNEELVWPFFAKSK